MLIDSSADASFAVCKKLCTLAEIRGNEAKRIRTHTIRNYSLAGAGHWCVVDIHRVIFAGVVSPWSWPLFRATPVPEFVKARLLWRIGLGRRRHCEESTVVTVSAFSSHVSNFRLRQSIGPLALVSSGVQQGAYTNAKSRVRRVERVIETLCACTVCRRRLFTRFRLGCRCCPNMGVRPSGPRHSVNVEHV